MEFSCWLCFIGVLLVVSMMFVAVSALLQPSVVVMDSNFKWDMPIHPTWTSVFTGTNDVNPHFPFIQKILSTIPPEDLELVTVVGGMSYLRILEMTTFAKITFFDANINELTKLRALHQLIIDHDYDQFVKIGGTKIIDASFHREPEEMYLPYTLHEAGVKFRTNKDFVWPISSIHGYKDPVGTEKLDDLWTVLGPKSYPQYEWSPKKEGYENVRRMLSDEKIVSEHFHLSLPCSVTSEARLAIVYVNGAPISASAIRAVSPSALAIGIHSLVDISHVKDFSKSWGGGGGGGEGGGTQQKQRRLGGQKLGADWWWDAHLWWEFAVRLRMAKFEEKRASWGERGNRNILRKMHVWSDVDVAEFQNSMYDWFFEASLSASFYLRASDTFSKMEQELLASMESVTVQ